jgi:methyltransferase family protein
MFDRLAAEAGRYYSGKFAEHGPTARGVDWNSEQSQSLRFEQLLSVVGRPSEPFSINDYGCGYGALADHLQAGGYSFTYTGFDLSEPMIDYARTNHPESCRWIVDEKDLHTSDYTVASGVMNVKQGADDTAWHDYCLHVIERLSATSARGFSFNMLTSYSDADRKRPDLYYGDPLVFFDYCKRRHARNVALLHDYGLYEFTLIVRKELP